MRPLLVCSLDPAAGKTALCVGLARRFAKDGIAVGYIKAIAAGIGVDPDALFVKEALALPDAAALLSPVGLRSRASNPLQAIRRALSRVGSHNQLVLIEGGHSLAEGAHLGLSGPELAAALDARVLLVLRYRVDLLDGAMVAARAFGSHLLGAVVNAAPPSQLARARDSLRPALEGAGVRVLGIVPQDRVLLGVAVRDLATRLGARVACGDDHLDVLVERLMIGAMSVDGALVYFRKHANKAVVTGGDRPDVQLAALATPTRCLVLTGGFEVDPSVLSVAQQARVPVLVTEHDTLGAVEAIRDLFTSSPFQQKAKLERLEALIEAHVEAATIRTLLGL